MPHISFQTRTIAYSFLSASTKLKRRQVGFSAVAVASSDKNRVG